MGNRKESLEYFQRSIEYGIELSEKDSRHPQLVRESMILMSVIFVFCQEYKYKDEGFSVALAPTLWKLAKNISDPERNTDYDLLPGNFYIAFAKMMSSIGDEEISLSILQDGCEKLKERYEKNDSSVGARDQYFSLLNGGSWQLISKEAYKDAENWSFDASMLDVDDERKRRAEQNLAHSILLQDRYVEALKIYLKNVEYVSPSGWSFQDALIKDIEEMKGWGINHPDFDKVIGALPDR